MLGPRALGAYSDDFVYEPTTTRERTSAAGVAIALALGLALVAAAGRIPVSVLPGFIPASEAVAIVASAFTAWMLFSQYRIRRHAPLAVLGAAYAMFGVFHVEFLLSFPGAFVPAGFLGSGPQSAPWLAQAALAGFGVAALMFAYMERTKRRQPRWRAGMAARMGAGMAGFVALASILAIGGHRLLPVIVWPDGSFDRAYTHVLAPLAGVLMFAASATVVMACGVSRRVHLWLSVVLFAMGLEIFSGAVFGGARFTLCWYLGQVYLATSTMLFFAVMQLQLASILRRAARNGERAIALHDVVSLGSESGESNAAMLDRAANDLHFDWACLAHVRGGWVILENCVGDAPYSVGFRAPAGAAWLRDAHKGRDLAILGEDDDGPWIDETPSTRQGSSMLVTVPVFVDGELYGLLGFGNVSQRRLPLDAADRTFLKLLGSLAGVTIARTRQRRQLNTLAYSDALTGLNNRASLFEQLQKEISVAQRYDREFALHFLDLDGFKAVNDTFGHAAGDQVLREVARRLAGAVRESDTVARLGGDEFVVLQTNLEHPKSAEHLAIRLRSVFEHPIGYGAESFRIGTSIGTSRYPQDGSDIHALLDRADADLYRKKARRRKPPVENRPVSVLRQRER